VNVLEGRGVERTKEAEENKVNEYELV